MAVVGFPLDAVDDSPSYTGRMLREALSVLVGGGTSARPLAGGSGVNPRTPSNTVTATATTWTVKQHGGYIDAQTDGEASGYLYAVNSGGGLPTGAMTAANATNPRIDLISVQVNDPAEGDGSAVPTVGIVYTPGVADASPAVPPKPARSMVLAQIGVPKFGGGNPVVTWVAPVMYAAAPPDTNAGVAVQAGRAVTGSAGYVTIAVDSSKFSVTPRIAATAVVAPQFQNSLVITRDDTVNFPYVTFRAYLNGTAKDAVAIEWIAVGGAG